jgi:hypothetical protein
MNQSLGPRLPGVRKSGGPVFVAGQRVSVRPSIYAKSSEPEMGTVVRMGNSPHQVRIQFDSGKAWTIPTSQIIGTVEE